MNQPESTNLDPRILGQLLLMQSILPTLPDETSIFRFVCRGLNQIPGVETVNHSEAIQENSEPVITRFPLTASGSKYGEFLFRVSDPLAFAPYADYIKNFSFMVAVILEERKQRRLNELHQVELEQRIQERTLELREEIAERQRTEDALRESERKFRETVVNLDEGFYSATVDGVLLEHNQAFNRILGFDEMVDLKGTNVPYFWQNPNERQEYLNAFVTTGSISNYQISAKTQKGRKVTLLVSAHMVNDENDHPLRIEGIFLDITERKRAEEELRKLSQKDEEALRIAHMGHWEFDLETSQFIFNDQYYSLHGTTAKEAGGYRVSAEKFASKYMHPDDAHSIGGAIKQIVDIKDPNFHVQREVRILRENGEPRNVIVWFRIEKDAQGRAIKLLGVSQDVTERKQVDAALRESETRYRTLFEHAPDGILIADPESYYIHANESICRMLGYTREELIGLHASDIVAQPEIQNIEPAVSMIKSGAEYHREWQFRCKDGSVFPADVIATVMPDGNLLGLVRDVTERKQAEQALRQSENEYRHLFQNNPNPMWAYDAETLAFLAVNDAAIRHYGYSRDEFLAMTIKDIRPPEDIPMLIQETANLPAGLNNPKIWRHLKKNGEIIYVEVRTHWSVFAGRQARIVLANDVTERKAAEEKIRNQFEHLTALGAIDQVIVSNLDLKLGLSKILTHVTTELGIDAANILTFNPNSQMLEFSAGYGFRTKAIESTRLLLGQSYAGQAALERHLIHVKNLQNAPDLILTKNLLEEGFVSYYAVPLIAKGQVKGVLEVFHRTPLEPDAEWLDFLNTLAGQVAIAVENATLFESLQRSNLELTLAYDATIEGWSRALDLRDKETEGHTLRVTEMALKLARAFGLSEDELVQVRWGALLHDIGKMGIPDEILHKAGPLTDKEWMLMKKHPTYAQEMLAPIHYLRFALDIPYCHHEKWDGSGYPQGLIGEQIPLAARIFALVDVWDALSSDRPYRAAWAEEKVRDYIQSSSGSHFDPRVVEVFLRISQ